MDYIRKQLYEKRKNGCDHGNCDTCPHRECIADIRLSDEYIAKTRTWAKNTRKKAYYSHKEQGLCTRCGNKATHGLLCEKHWLARKTERKRHRAKTFVFKVKNEELCSMCRKSPRLEGHKTCENCYSLLVKAAEHARKYIDRKNHIWRKTNFTKH